MRKLKYFKTSLTLCAAVCISVILFAFNAGRPGTPVRFKKPTAIKQPKSAAIKKPEDNRFVKTVLSNDLNEPMQLAIAPDMRVFFIERAGNFYVYNPADNKTTLIYKFPVKAVEKILQGMLGMTIDPDFRTNNYIYFYYSTQVGDAYKNRLSRFVISKNSVLDLQSEKVLLDVPLDAEVSAHSGGSLAWDKYKNLYLSTGDNTVPFESEGYAPIDMRPGRTTFDAERSAGNTNDLRGKILRIHPEANGTYTIPDGNLFKKRTLNTLPEIYVMGCRNPYRISVDPETSILYWGEVGPDAGTDGKQGPRGYDEINQAKKAGNFGWPFFVGDNKPYTKYDFKTQIVGDLFDVNAPENLSPNNTGLKILPPAQKAMVWFPYDVSPEFPVLGKGGRCIIGGPVYHYNPALKSNTKFPEYYDKVLFVGDYMRNWIFGVRMDENQNYTGLDQLMETNGDFRRPIDIKFGPEGSFYILEYGSAYGLDNPDARLVRVDYNAGNRAPVAKIATRDTIGLKPYKVVLNQKSFDYDADDKLSYKWLLNDKTVISTAENPVYTFLKNGVYKITLKVTDAGGKSSTDTKVIKVGNTPPQVAISTSANSSFFFPGEQTFDYKVAIKDREDKTIDPKRVKIGINYIARVENNQNLTGHQEIAPTYNYGKALMAKSDCKACHQIYTRVLGPPFIEVAKRYAGNKKAVDMLAVKIIKGGGGVWGEHAMSAHPQLSKDDASEIVKYILTLNEAKSTASLPRQGNITLKDHVANNNEGRYILTASYTDKGGAITPLTTTESIVLRPAKVQAESADIFDNIDKREKAVYATDNKAYFGLKNVDLKNIVQLTYSYLSKNLNGTIEVHIDSPDGQVISTLNFTAAADQKQFTRQSTPVTDPQGKHDLYFVFTKNKRSTRGEISVDWVSFDKF
ncbi:PQQ-dependent sugar dehydrogenase [Mucilaginibacter sp. UR6-11]|uniref:PQQ-dependent sugar dehydrogenase n=1 Tax=Mucilaginibacter sp. UR6-11 TaxID=1435644 RepID=UPI001E544259|nr:PQQ-dependent sugar dehydrogenase [Mucilaginibacter sp. UR6-11]MCC8426304.1 PQQ-dependent sugar dehydrogenase [Mucilaginibacter sp. UR6-11]